MLLQHQQALGTTDKNDRALLRSYMYSACIALAHYKQAGHKCE
jgi:hypothetical protein